MDTNSNDQMIQEAVPVNTVKPIKIMVSYEIVETNNAEIIALIGRLLGKSDLSTTEKPAQPKKSRKTRIWTDEEKAAFHAKMVAARGNRAAIKTQQIKPTNTPSESESKSRPNVELDLAESKLKLSKAGLVNLAPSAKVLDPKLKVLAIPSSKNWS